MPNLWNRMRDIVTASSHARLDAIENPAVMSQQLIREIDDDLQGIRGHLLAALSRLRQIEVSQRKLGQRAEQHKARARQALAQGDDAQARHHLALQLKLTAEIETLDELAANQKQWVAGLKDERATLLREREDLASQARVIQLRQGLETHLPGTACDPYSRVLQRRERMQGYAQRVEANLHTLQAAQDLRAEELEGQREPIDEPDLDAALDALRTELTGAAQ